MKARNFSVNPYWDKRFIKKGTGACPVVLTINIGSYQFRVGLKLYSTKQDFEKAMSGRGGSASAQELRSQIQSYAQKAEQILENLANPTKELFLRFFKFEMNLPASKKKQNDVVLMFHEKIAELKKEERWSTAENCHSALKSLLRFKKDFSFQNIDERFLRNYKAWMEAQGNSLTTTQIYLRNLKSIFNRAIKVGFIPERLYPFKNFSIGSSSKSKDVLYQEQIKVLWEYKPEGLRENRSKAYFFFSYLCNGMNFKDIAFLKMKDIHGDYFSFVREKTKRTTMTEKNINVYLHPEAKKIIDKWGNKNSDSEYVFPILNDCKNTVHLHNTYLRHRKVINKKLSGIGIKLGFDVHLCMNLARHSFATKLKIDGMPTSYISDAMGHSNSKVTEHYLKTIPIDAFKQISQSLLKF